MTGARPDLIAVLRATAQRLEAGGPPSKLAHFFAPILDHTARPPLGQRREEKIGSGPARIAAARKPPHRHLVNPDHT